MVASCILILFALGFVAAASRRMRRKAAPDLAVRTWLVVAFVFTAVSAWLQWHTS